MADSQTVDSRTAPFVGSELSDADYESVRRLIVERCGFDLGSYKNPCIRRRIAARIRARGFRSAPPYLEVLSREQGEPEALLSALTIHVSQFFRNPSTYAVLERQVLPKLFAVARPQDSRPLRLWSVGCAEGEEPYSLALILAELAPKDPVEILATDLSDAALQRAADGVFAAERLVTVPQEMRTRYFEVHGERFRLRREIRSMVAFRRHNLLESDAFPAAELILCRNVLIYFSREEQEEILRRFAAGLPSGGYLVLGRAEMLLGEMRRLFDIESPAERIYRRK
ncbi:MAG TPA: protein-glutamate O-methyltransferase CheR [Desulfuromonadales bacterium]|nr:protein-glutamate O-methyltransferase CheR [Desulfuromonadales bacterium]